MRSVRLQLLVTLAATAVAAGFFIHRGPPPKQGVWEAVFDENWCQLGRLVRWHARVRTYPGSDITPIQCRMKYGSREITAFLFRYEVFAEEDRAHPPLCYAVQHASAEAAALLIECGADVSVKDREGGTPLHYALVNGRKDVVSLLRKHGATE